jgi:hypothetical protein
MLRQAAEFENIPFRSDRDRAEWIARQARTEIESVLQFCRANAVCASSAVWKITVELIPPAHPEHCLARRGP